MFGVSVSIDFVNLKKNKYKGILIVRNTSYNNYRNWYIVCNLPPGITIEDCDKFTIKKISTNQVHLIPSNKISGLDAGETFSDKIKGNGSVVPSDFSFVNIIYDLPLTNLTELQEFKYQYSYDQDTGKIPNSKYFNASSEGLEINIYKGDKAFLPENSTFPRTELRGLTPIYDDIKYTLSFDHFIKEYPKGFQYCWVQVFGKNGPNVMLRYRNDTYQLLAIQGHNQIVTLPGDVNDNINIWTNWKIEFCLSVLNGYIKVYRNNIFIGETKGNTSGDNNSYVKLGLYSQQMDPNGTMTSYIKNLQLCSY